MTYFYGQLFAMDTEIRAMFPAAMDIQRRRFFRALLRILGGQDDLAALVPTSSDSAARTASTGSASSTMTCSGGR